MRALSFTLSQQFKNVRVLLGLLNILIKTKEVPISYFSKFTILKINFRTGRWLITKMGVGVGDLMPGGGGALSGLTLAGSQPQRVILSAPTFIIYKMK